LINECAHLVKAVVVVGWRYCWVVVDVAVVVFAVVAGLSIYLENDRPLGVFGLGSINNQVIDGNPHNKRCTF
jgi:hypothetical protein